MEMEMVRERSYNNEVKVKKIKRVLVEAGIYEVVKYHARLRGIDLDRVIEENREKELRKILSQLLGEKIYEMLIKEFL